jgi:exopolysaccharide biosynthesis protein
MLLLVLDGRHGIKIGATLQDAQQIMLQYGAFNATNLDGGSSTTMYYDGDIINNPCDPLGERAIASAIVVIP